MHSARIGTSVRFLLVLAQLRPLVDDLYRASRLLWLDALAQPGDGAALVGTGMIESQRSFHGIEGYCDMRCLVDAVRAEVARLPAEGEEGYRSPGYDKAAA